MFHTFNMGIGMIIVVDAANADKAMELVPKCRVIGEIVEGDEVIIA